MLTEFFQSELPRTWPPITKLAQTRLQPNRRFARARLLILAAMLLACIGLSALGEVPGTWPASTGPREQGKLEAKRSSKSKASAALPGKSLSGIPAAKP